MSGKLQMLLQLTLLGIQMMCGWFGGVLLGVTASPWHAQCTISASENMRKNIKFI